MKKELKTERTKEKIIAAGIAEFGENGYFGASLNHMSSTGISKGLIYHNFANKDEIYLACVERCFVKFITYLQEQEPTANLKEYLGVRFLFFKENKKEAKLFFEAMLQPPSHLYDQIETRKTKLKEMNVEIYGKLLSNLVLRDSVSMEEALLYFSLIQDMFHGHFSHQKETEQNSVEMISAAYEDKLEQVLDFMLYGIVKEGK